MTVIIGQGPPTSVELREGDGVIVVDVIRSMTTAVTGCVLGRRCLPVPSVKAAFARVRAEPDAILVGETGGERPDGFELTNSPAAVAARTDLERPMVLLSSSGTPLLCAAPGLPTYLGCLRNWQSTARLAAARHERVVVLGAATRGDFREEDELCAAWIAEATGLCPEDGATARAITRWSGLPAEAFLASRSVAYLRATGQEDDLDFILDHVGDVDRAYELDFHKGEVMACDT